MHVDPKLVLGILGNITAMAMYVSPAPTIVRILKLKSTQEFSGLPYACGLMNSLVWALYGTPFVKPHSILILTVNAFGIATELTFSTIYLAFATHKSKIRMAKYLICVFMFYCGAIMVVFIGLHSKHMKEVLVGSFGMAITIALYGSPLSMMGIVIRTKSVEFMPFSLASCNFTNSAIWLAYALVTKDIFLGVPNGLGCIFGVLQFVLYGLFYKRPIHPPLKPEDKEKDKLDSQNHSVCVSIEKIQT